MVTDSTLMGGDNGDTIQINGVMSDSVVDGGDNNDAIVTDAAISGARLIGGDGSDQFQLNGAFTDARVELSHGDDNREDGNDTVYIGDRLSGDLTIMDRFHSSATWNGRYLEDQDTVILQGDGWSESGEAGEAGNALTRRSADGLYNVRLNLGTGDNDGQIEQIVILGADGETEILRAELPDLMKKPFGVAVGQWAQLVIDVVLSAINPGFALIVAAKNMAMAASSQNWMAFAAAALSLVGSFGSALAQGATSAATQTAGETISRVAGYAKNGVQVVGSLTDGDVSLGDVAGVVGVIGGTVAQEMGLNAARSGRLGNEAAQIGDVNTANELFQRAYSIGDTASDISRITHYVSGGLGVAESLTEHDVTVSDMLSLGRLLGAVAVTELDLGAQRNLRLATNAMEAGDQDAAQGYADNLQNLTEASRVIRTIDDVLRYSEAVVNSFDDRGQFNGQGLIPLIIDVLDNASEDNDT